MGPVHRAGPHTVRAGALGAHTPWGPVRRAGPHTVRAGALGAHTPWGPVRRAGRCAVRPARRGGRCAVRARTPCGPTSFWALLGLRTMPDVDSNRR
ncbi:MAG: hypothetical protein KatS3mg055_0979 [Chloroflexus sp.]|nr:MAG: hypothetical protein KatS3mg055_0979 [Chloroflexus sp.]